MKCIISLLLILVSTVNLSLSANENTDQHQAVKKVIQTYIDSTVNAEPERLTSAFHADATLLLSHPEKPFWQVSVKEYAGWFNTNKTKRAGHILSIQVDGNIATARARITTAAPAKQFIDQFLLKRFADGWKIVSKTAHQTELQQPIKQFEDAMGKRVLFIASSADSHGDSEIPTGTSFAELVHAYDVFINAGYQVDFVSPDGGMLPLAYINTSDPIHRKYLYDRNFMYALAHTYAPQEVDASHYIAVHYVGGGNAMYQVAENRDIQNISMAVYERNNGIISAVCHGTAGLANLKLENGDYLVSGRKISGYPIEFEKTDAAYYQQFPFEIETVIEHRGGKFSYGKPNQSYVVVDERIITGTNYQSSKAVAEAMVSVMNGM